MNKRIITALLVFNFLCMMPFSMQYASGNPLVITQMNLGHALIVSNNITMPQAYVDVVIDPTVQGEYSMDYNISIDCEFILHSNTTHTTMIGFAYPNQWDDMWARGTFTEFTIWFDGESVAYEIIEPPEVENDTLLNEQADWLNYTSYAVITASFTADTNSTLLVSRQLVGHIADGSFLFRYVAGTGAAWTGPTREEIHFTVTDTTYMTSHSFSPQEGMVTESSGTSTSATWILEEFTPDNALIGFSCTQDADIVREGDATIIVVVCASCVGVVLIIVIFQRRR